MSRKRNKYRAEFKAKVALDEGPVMGLERRGWIDRLYDVVNHKVGGAIE
ncbi:MAG: hypothetical protein JRJ47_14445 [Deltaproteobacteria bacterium]|nr:hypothetical protein [Deltaproteobacteria bacterium]